MRAGKISTELFDQIEELETEIAFSIQIMDIQVECDWDSSTCTYEDKTTPY